MSDYQPPEDMIRSVLDYSSWRLTDGDREHPEELNAAQVDQLWQLLCCAAVTALHVRAKAPRVTALTRKHLSLVSLSGALTEAGEAIVAERAAARERRRARRKPVTA